MSKTPQARFTALFGPGSADRPGLPRPLRDQVFIRMKYSLQEEDGRKLRSVRSYFLRTFHPDAVGGVFTPAERHAVFVTIPHIFNGEDLA